jgi:hypothetical protein
MVEGIEVSAVTVDQEGDQVSSVQEEQSQSQGGDYNLSMSEESPAADPLPNNQGEVEEAPSVQSNSTAITSLKASALETEEGTPQSSQEASVPFWSML